MKIPVKAGTTNLLIHLFISDSSSTSGAGLTGLSYNTSGLTAYFIRPGDTVTHKIYLSAGTLGTYGTGGTSWVAGTAYVAGDIVVPPTPNGFIYVCTVGGTSGTSAPTFPTTLGATVVDNTVTWECAAGGSFVEIDATNMPGWYELSVPNVCLESGFNTCGLHLQGALNMAPLPIELYIRENTEKDIYDRIGTPAGTSVSADIATIDANVDAILDYTGTSGVVVATNNDKTGYSIAGTKTTLDDLNDITAVSVWDVLTSDILTASSIGQLLTANIDASISSRATDAATASSVWEELRANHTTVGSFGEGVIVITNNDKSGYSISGVKTTLDDLNDISTSDVLAQIQAGLDEAFDDSSVLTANGLKDRIRTLMWILRNKITITDATGDLTIYKDDSLTVAFSVLGALTDDATTTTRLRIG